MKNFCFQCQKCLIFMIKVRFKLLRPYEVGVLELELYCNGELFKNLQQSQNGTSQVFSKTLRKGYLNVRKICKFLKRKHFVNRHGMEKLKWTTWFFVSFVNKFISHRDSHIQVLVYFNVVSTSGTSFKHISPFNYLLKDFLQSGRLLQKLRSDWKRNEL